MSCNNRNLRNLDTNIYSSSNGCCDTDYEVKMVERLIPCYVYPPRPMPPFEPIPQPPHPPVPPFLTPTAAYALFYNNSATGATSAAGETLLISQLFIILPRQILSITTDLSHFQAAQQAKHIL